VQRCSDKTLLRQCLSNQRTTLLLSSCPFSLSSPSSPFPLAFPPFLLTEARRICLIIVRAEEAGGAASAVHGKLTPMDVSQLRDDQDGVPQRSPSLLLNIAVQQSWKGLDTMYIIILIGEEFWRLVYGQGLVRCSSIQVPE
jgi:hypothetical protein